MGLLDKIKKSKKDSDELATRTGANKHTKESAAKSGDLKEAAPEVVRKGEAGRGAAYKVIRRPLVSEKATLGETKGKYTFVIHEKATKTEVKTAIERIYGVRPESVRTVHVEGKDVRFGRTNGKRKDWKKAIVTLPKGKTISIHEGV